MYATPTIFVGLCGYAQSGKDTAAAALAMDLDFERHALADPLKEMALAINPICPSGWYLVDYIAAVGGFDAAKQHPEVRRFLQRLGTEGVRQTFGDNAWLDLLFRRTQDVPRVVVPDVRFPNEFHGLREEGALLIWIARPGTRATEHASESSLYRHMAHVVLENDGSVEDLGSAVYETVANWLSGQHI